MKHAIILVAAVWLVSCATAPRRGADPARSALFPYGTYHHDVRVQTAGVSQRFRGVVAAGAERIRVVGLGPFSTTAFRLTEERSSGDLSVEIFHDALKPHEPKLREFYALVRAMMLFPRKGNAQGVTITETGPDGMPRKASFAGSEGTPGAELVLSEYDANGIPKRIEVTRPELRIDVTVIDYELTP